MAVIAGPPPTAELRTHPLCRDELVEIASSSSRLASVAGVTRRQLAAESWVMREEGSETRRLVVAGLRRHHILPQHLATFAGPDAMKRVVAAGLGIAIVSRMTVACELEAGELCALDVRTMPSRDIAVVDHPQKHHGAACSAMLRLLGVSPASTGAARRRR